MESGLDSLGSVVRAMSQSDYACDDICMLYITRYFYDWSFYNLDSGVGAFHNLPAGDSRSLHVQGVLVSSVYLGCP